MAEQKNYPSSEIPGKVKEWVEEERKREISLFKQAQKEFGDRFEWAKFSTPEEFKKAGFVWLINFDPRIYYERKTFDTGISYEGYQQIVQPEKLSLLIQEFSDNIAGLYGKENIVVGMAFDKKGQPLNKPDTADIGIWVKREAYEEVQKKKRQKNQQKIGNKNKIFQGG